MVIKISSLLDRAPYESPECRVMVVRTHNLCIGSNEYGAPGDAGRDGNVDEELERF